MNILNWNCRGINSCRKKKQILHDLVNDNKIDILVVQKIKKEDFTLRFLQDISARLDEWQWVPSLRKFAGLLFGCHSNKIKVLACLQQRFYLDVILENKVDSNIWQFIIVYGLVLRHLKKTLWTTLDQIRQPQYDFWILCGDFNAVRQQTKKSGHNFDVTFSTEFNTFINKHSLVEHKLHTSQYTWSNGTYFALLDRILIGVK